MSIGIFGTIADAVTAMMGNLQETGQAEIHRQQDANLPGLGETAGFI